MSNKQLKSLTERLQGMGLIPINKTLAKKKPKTSWRRRFW